MKIRKLCAQILNDWKTEGYRKQNKTKMKREHKEKEEKSKENAEKEELA